MISDYVQMQSLCVSPLVWILTVFSLLPCWYAFSGQSPEDMRRAEITARTFLEAEQAEDWDACIRLMDPQVAKLVKDKNSVLGRLSSIPEGRSLAPLPTRNYWRGDVLIQNAQIKKGEKWLDVVLVLRKSGDGQWKVFFCHPSRLVSLFADSMQK